MNMIEICAHRALCEAALKVRRFKSEAPCRSRAEQGRGNKAQFTKVPIFNKFIHCLSLSHHSVLPTEFKNYKPEC